MYTRLHAVGLVSSDSFQLPVTQTDLGDALGLSTVHVNRTLKQLRSDRLITMRQSVVVVFDWDRLKEAGEFDPSYLTSVTSQIAEPRLQDAH
jgi:DNA-binding transcriptional regulator LsrR (DeoR family)